MVNPIILLVTCLILIKSTTSLKCYVTDITFLKAADRILNNVEECTRYLNVVQKEYKIGKIDEISPMRCFTVDLETPDKTYAVKGCAPKGSCSTLVKPLIERQANKRDLIVRWINCYECAHNACNK